MDCVLRDEPVAPIIKRRSKLSRPAGRFGDSPVWTKSEVRAAYQNRSAVWVIWCGDTAIRSSIRGIDPIIDRQSRVGDARFGIDFGKPGIEHLSFVGDSIAIG